MGKPKIVQDIENINEQLNEKATQTDLDTTNAELLKKRDKSIEITMLDLAQDVKTAMTGGSVAVTGVGAVSDVNIKDGKVIPEKTNFLVSKGNLFNKNGNRILNGYYNDIGVFTTNTNYFTVMLHVKPNTVYANNITVKSYLAFFDGGMNFISAIGVGAWTTINVPNNANIYYVSVPIHKDDNPDNIMIVEGNTLPSTYIPYGYKLDNVIDLSDNLNTKVLTNDNLGIYPIGKNLFDKSKVISGKEVYSDGSIQTEPNSMVTPHINVEGLSNIYISGLTPYAAGLSRFSRFYDSNNVALGSNTPIDKSLSETGLSVPANAEYYIMSVYQRKTSTETINLDTIQIEKGTIKTEYESYIEGIKSIKGYNISGVQTSATNGVKTSGKQLLAFGDSITETADISNDGLTYTEGVRNNWPTFSKGMLDLGSMWNYAKSGASYTDDSLLTQYRQKLSEQINMAIANNQVNPDIIVVSLGTNDTGRGDNPSALGTFDTAMSKSTLASLDRTIFYESVRWAFWKLKTQYPNAVCFCATPIQGVSKGMNANILNAITQMAHRYNFILIDAQNESGIVKDFEVENANGRYLSDGLHPNTAGQQLMAKLYTRVILNTFNY